MFSGVHGTQCHGLSPYSRSLFVSLGILFYACPVWLRLPGRMRRCVCLRHADARERNRLAVGKFHDEGQIAAHGFNVATQGRKQEVAALLNAGNAFLSDA